MVLKRKEIMAAALVALIGVAGYLNWSYRDTIQVTDGESYTETGKRLGEAQYVSAVSEEEETPEESGELTMSEDSEEAKTVSSSVNVSETDYFADIRLEKEASRSRAKEILTETAENENFDEDIRQTAQKQILTMAENVESETAIESAAKAKGFDNISVFINEGIANVSVKKKDFSSEDAAKIQELVISQTGLSVNNIKIIEIK